MKTESNVKPALIEHYGNFVRINYGVTEEIREAGDEKSTVYVYNMIELPRLPSDIDELSSLLTNDKYCLEEQVKLFSNGDNDAINALNDWRKACRRTARKLLGISDTLVSVKEDKIDEIVEYDHSKTVNQFSIDGISMWLEPEERAKLRMRFESEKASGLENTSLWYGSMKIDLTVDKAIALLNAIELYACECYDVTATHKAKVMALTSIEDVKDYDYTVGYPDKLKL